jgi:hypothetical protein
MNIVIFGSALFTLVIIVIAGTICKHIENRKYSHERV